MLVLQFHMRFLVHVLVFAYFNGSHHFRMGFFPILKLEKQRRVVNFPNRKKKRGPHSKALHGIEIWRGNGRNWPKWTHVFGGLMFRFHVVFGRFLGCISISCIHFFIIGTPMPSDRQYTPRDELSKGSIFFPAKHGPWTFVGNEAGPSNWIIWPIFRATN